MDPTGSVVPLLHRHLFSFSSVLLPFHTLQSPHTSQSLEDSPRTQRTTYLGPRSSTQRHGKQWVLRRCRRLSEKRAKIRECRISGFREDRRTSKWRADRETRISHPLQLLSWSVDCSHLSRIQQPPPCCCYCDPVSSSCAGQPSRPLCRDRTGRVPRRLPISLGRKISWIQHSTINTSSSPTLRLNPTDGGVPTSISSRERSSLSTMALRRL